MSHWNDATRSAIEGYPHNRYLKIEAGETTALLTISLSAQAAVHHVFCESHTGDSTLTLPASSGGQTIHIHNNRYVDFDFKGLLTGGDFIIDGAGVHYLISYVLPF